MAQSLNNLAALLQDKGDYAAAEPLYRRALAIREKALGPDHPNVALSLNNLAVLLWNKGDYAAAEPRHRRALAIREKGLGPGHPDVAASLDNLAVLLQNKGDYAAAEPLHRRALAIRKKALGPGHPDVAASLDNLAVLLQDKGDYAAAEPLYRGALAIREKALGPDHPNVATSLDILSALLWAQGKSHDALSLLARGLAIREHHLGLLLPSGSEAQKQAYLSKLSGETDITISLHADALPTDPAAARLALETLLRRKARALDATAQTLGALHAHAGPAERKLLAQWHAALGRVANLTLRGPGDQPPEQWRKEVAELQAEAHRLEVDLAGRSAAFRTVALPITLTAVQAALPVDAVLVEIAAYQPFDPKAKSGDPWGKRRYVAYVLHHTGDPVLVRLGDADTLDATALTLRQAISKEAPLAEVKASGRALDAALLARIRPAFGATTRVLVSPDGALGLVPLAAVVDEQGRFAVETLDISYLSSGRDLLRLQTRTPSQGAPVVVAAPDYGSTGKQVADHEVRPGREVSRDLKRGGFQPLRGTAAEAKALGPLLPGAKVLLGVEATEAAVKAVHGPAVLHIATHGFFLQDQHGIEALHGARGAQALGLREPGSAAHPRPLPLGWENPLLRSGLALAGANRPSAKGDDGLLTALEAAGLDLWGTRLVVLSACETGLGEARDGQGVFGLRRALVLAGAETVVMSLWNVDDDATRDLMAAWYGRLANGQARGDALRTVQLEMLAGKRGQAWRHPAYWAAFVGSGEWRGM